jgi:hypothetical protein
MDEDMQRRLSSFTRWWKLTRHRIGVALEDTCTELKTTPRTTASTRSRKAFDEADVIRKGVESPAYEGVSAEALWKAWASGEKNVSIYSGKGSKPTAKELVAHLRDPNVVPGPHSAEDIAGMAVVIHENDVYKP